MQPQLPLYIGKEKVAVGTTRQNKLPSVQWRNKQNNSPVGYRMRKWYRLTCLQEFTDTATQWATDGHDWSWAIEKPNSRSKTIPKPVI